MWKGRVEAVWETWVGRTTVLESKDDFFRECPEVPFFEAFVKKLPILSNVLSKRFVFDHMTLITRLCHMTRLYSEKFQNLSFQLKFVFCEGNSH